MENSFLCVGFDPSPIVRFTTNQNSYASTHSYQKMKEKSSLYEAFIFFPPPTRVKTYHKQACRQKLSYERILDTTLAITSHPTNEIYRNLIRPRTSRVETIRFLFETKHVSYKILIINFDLSARTMESNPWVHL